MWKAAFKKVKGVSSASSRPYPFKLLMAVFHKFYFVHSWMLSPIIISSFSKEWYSVYFSVFSEKIDFTLYQNVYYAAGNYMFKVNNSDTRTRCEICSMLVVSLIKDNATSYMRVNKIQIAFPFIVQSTSKCTFQSSNSWHGFFCFWEIKMWGQPYQ